MSDRGRGDEDWMRPPADPGADPPGVDLDLGAPSPWTAPGAWAPPGRSSPPVPPPAPGGWAPAPGPPGAPFGAPPGAPPGGWAPAPGGLGSGTPWAPPTSPWGAPPPPAAAPRRRPTLLLVVIAVTSVVLLLAIVLATVSSERIDPGLDPSPFSPLPDPVSRPPVDRGFTVVWSTALAPDGVVPAALEVEDLRIGISGDTVAVITESGQVVGYAKGDGRFLWSTSPQRDQSGVTATVPPRSEGSGGSGAPANPTGRDARIDGIRVSGGGYFVVQKYLNGYGIDPTDGHVLWGVPGTFFMAGPTFPDAFTRQGGSMRRQGREPGDEWLFAMPSTINSTSVTAGADLVVFGTGEEVIGVDRATGKERWSVPAPVSRVQDVEVTSGMVMVLDADGSVTALDLTTGEERWTHPADSMLSELSAIGTDMIVVHDIFEGFVALDTATGEVRWQTDAQGWQFTRGRVGERAVILADAAGFIALDRTTGAVLAERAGPDLVGAAATDGDVACIVTTKAPPGGSPTRPPGSGVPGSAAPGGGEGTTTTTRRSGRSADTAAPYLVCLRPG